MPTRFSLTLDSGYHSLVLVAGEEIIDDVTDVRITRTAGGGYDCEVTRAGGGAPARLVASASEVGRQALGRANGRESVPGFVELNPQPIETRSSVRDDIARYFSRGRAVGG